MTSEPTEKETKRKLEELLNLKRAKIFLGLKDRVSDKPSIPKNEMIAEINNIKEAIYSIFDNLPTLPRYVHGDLFALVMVSMFEDLVVSNKIPIERVSFFVAYWQQLLHLHFQSKKVPTDDSNSDT